MTPAGEKVIDLLNFFTEEIEVLEGELARLGADPGAGLVLSDLKPERQRIAQAHHRLTGLMDKILKCHVRGGQHEVGGD